MTLSDESTAKLKHAAIYLTGFPALLVWGGLLAVLAGLCDLLDAWLGRGAPLFPVEIAMVAVILGVVATSVGGVLHDRRYMAKARQAGLSASQAEALFDQADEEQDD